MAFVFPSICRLCVGGITAVPEGVKAICQLHYGSTVWQGSDALSMCRKPAAEESQANVHNHSADP